jgi:hypothetical protein
MKGLSHHLSENSEDVRFGSRGILFVDGMFRVYGSSGIWEQKNGRCSASENT